MSLLNDVLKDLNKSKRPVTVGPLLASPAKFQFFRVFSNMSPWVIAPFVNALLFLTAVYLYDHNKMAHETVLSYQPGAYVLALQKDAMVEPSNIPAIVDAQAAAQKTLPLLSSALPNIPSQPLDLDAAPIQPAHHADVEADEVSPINKVFSPLTNAEWHDEQLNLALVAIQDNRDDNAEQILNRILTRFPRAIVARETLANLYLAQERFDSARQTVDAGLLFAPSAITLNTIKARILFEEKHPKEALAVLKQFSPGVAKYPDFYGLMAAILQSLGQQQEADALYKILVKVEPENPQYWLGYGLALEHSKENKQAITAYRAVTEHYEADPEVRVYAENRLKTLQG